MLRQLRALLWKEWRQMRAVGLTLAGGMVALPLAVRAWEASDPHPGGMAGPALWVYVLFAAAVLGGTAIAGERGTRMLAFVLEGPVTWPRVWLAKLAGAFLLWAALLAVAAGVCLLLPRETHAGEDFRAAAADAVRFGLVVFCACFLVSSVVGRAVTATVVGGAAAVGLLVGTFVLYPSTRMGGQFAAGRFVVPCLLSAGLLGLSWWAFGRVRMESGSVWRTARILGLALGLAAVGLLLPHTVGYVHLYGTLSPRQAEEAFWMRTGPDGTKVAFVMQVNGSPFNSFLLRECILDCTTGQARCLTRFNSSFHYAGGQSPNGRYLVYRVEDDWLTQFLNEAQVSRASTPERHRVGIVDTLTGAARLVGDPPERFLTDSVLGVEGAWADDDLLVLYQRGEFVGYRMSTAELRPLDLPRPHSGYTLEPCGRRGGSGLAVLRCESDALGEAPAGSGRALLYDSATRAWKEYPLPERCRVLDVTRDKRLMLVQRPIGQPASVPVQIEILDLGSGTSRLIEKAADNLTVSEMGTARFSPGGRWVSHRLVELRDPTPAVSDTLVLFDTRDGKRRELRPPGVAHSWRGIFPGDESQLVWIRGQPKNPKELRAWTTARLYVCDIESGALRALPIPEGLCPPICHLYVYPAGEDAVIFSGYKAVICRIRLDGTHLEMLYPERKSIAAASPEATR